MKLQCALLLAALTTALPATADQAVPLLGLSLGGKFPAIKQCTMNQIGSDKVMCWIAAPIRGKDGMEGQINFPNSENRPSWAANGSFHVTVGSTGNLESLSVYGTKASERAEIVRSIEARFGRSTYEAAAGDGGHWESWKKGPVYISVLCSHRNDCSTRFVSEDGNRKELARMAEVAARKAARPVSP